MERPHSILALGILNIAFGLVGMAGPFTQRSMMTAARVAANPALAVMRDNPGWNQYQSYVLPITAVFSAVAFVAGIGLLKMRPWSRKLSIGYGIWLIVLVLVNAFAMAKFLFPAMIAKAAALSGAPAMIVNVTAYALLSAGLFGLIYPGFLLYFMTRPRVKDALEQAVSPPSLAR